MNNSAIHKKIVRTLAKLPDNTVNDGAGWYYIAHGHARALAAKYNLTVEQSAGIIAVLSPGTNWNQNLQDAEELCKYGDGAIVTTYGPNKRKAIALLNGGAVADNVRGQKVSAFYDNIVRPDESKAVTIDRHMIRFMTGLQTEAEMKAIYSSKKKYSALADIIRYRAEKINLKPWQLQAMLWLQVREG